MNDDAIPAGDDITLRDVVNHMSHGFGLIDTQCRKLDQRFDRLENKVDQLEGKVDQIEGKLDRNRAEIITNREAIDNLYDNIDELKKADIAIEKLALGKQHR